MKRFLTLSGAALMTITTALAQDPAPKTVQKESEISGCLIKSDSNFMITSTSGERVPVMGPGGLLDAHANHEVKITGTKTTSPDGKTTSFSATKVDMVSSNCITKS